MPHKKSNCIRNAITLVILSSQASHAAEFVVQTTGDTGGGAATLVSGDTYNIDTLRSAIELANDEVQFEGADSITFDAVITSSGPATIDITAVGDTYNRYGQISNSGFGIDSDITLSGTADRSEITLEAGALRHFQINSLGKLSLNNITLSGGEGAANLSGEGGSVIVRPSGELNVNNCHFDNNQAYRGGAIGMRYGTAQSTITNSLFTNNTTLNVFYSLGPGGAISIGSYSQLNLVDSTLSNNTAGPGGALFSSGTAVIHGSTFNNNQANSGGAIHTNNVGISTITNSTIANNNSNFQGGGILLGSYNLVNTLVNSTIAGNQSLTNTARITDNEIFGGVSLDSSGGGIAASEENNLIMHNVLVTNNTETMANTPDDVAAILDASSSFNLIGVGDSIVNISDGANGNQIGTLANPIDALTGTLGDNGGPTQTVLLDPQSPAINAGSNTEATNLSLMNDQRGTGFPRILGNQVDIGALEIDLIFKSGFEVLD